MLFVPLTHGRTDALEHIPGRLAGRSKLRGQLHCGDPRLSWHTDRTQETTASRAYGFYEVPSLPLHKPDGGSGHTDTVHWTAGKRGGSRIWDIHTLLSTAKTLNIPGTEPRWKTVSEMFPMGISSSSPCPFSPLSGFMAQFYHFDCSFIWTVLRLN